MNRQQRRRAAKTTTSKIKYDAFDDALATARRENPEAIKQYLAGDRKDLLLIASKGYYEIQSDFPQVGKFTVAKISRGTAQAIATKVGAHDVVGLINGLVGGPVGFGVMVMRPEQRFFGFKAMAET